LLPELHKLVWELRPPVMDRFGRSALLALEQRCASGDPLAQQGAQWLMHRCMQVLFRQLTHWWVAPPGARTPRHSTPGSSALRPGCAASACACRQRACRPAAPAGASWRHLQAQRPGDAGPPGPLLLLLLLLLLPGDAGWCTAS
jgi:hypothetical protein